MRLEPGQEQQETQKARTQTRALLPGSLRVKEPLPGFSDDQESGVGFLLEVDSVKEVSQRLD